ncbi:MAG TPA: response regulator transcription factor [Blastocatellia bacterium]|nr:response regulator transcription factor [Blastocatellia bacterium]
MKLLIVEDNEQMRLLIKSFVSDIAESVIECSDGAEALAAYREHQPDWVLMDIKMGQVDGIAATRQIRAIFPSARIMIVTDHDDARLRKAAWCAGAREYVLKEDLLVLRRILTPH